jgi:hypothetical protein
MTKVNTGDELYMPLEPAKHPGVDSSKYLGTIALRYHVEE